MDIKRIFAEVETEFPFLEMPGREELIPSTPRYIESTEVQADLREFQESELTKEGIRTIHRYLPVLSDKAIAWIFPHILRFCLLDEATANTRMVTQSFIFSLSPAIEFHAETWRRYCLLSDAQIRCLVHFLEWCLEDGYWDSLCMERIHSGIVFLTSERKLSLDRSSSPSNIGGGHDGY